MYKRQVLESLVKAAEKVAQLLEYREKRRKARYDMFIAPLYQALQVVHADYLRMFETCLAGLSSDQELQVLASDAASERLANEPLRRDLAAKIRVFRQSMEEEPFVNFFQAAEVYLTVPKDLHRATIEKLACAHDMQLASASSMLSGVLQAASAEERRGAWLSLSPARRDLLEGYLQALLDNLRKRWDRLAQAHAKALMHTA